jgi:hypothetical protein
MYQSLKDLDGYGIIGGEWSFGNGNREVWFTGDFWVNGLIQKHRPPSSKPKKVKTEEGHLLYHDVMFTPNWFIARRDTLESIYWDERLKLQEHSEFFARMAAVRAKRNEGYKEKDQIWLDRFERRSDGNVEQKTNSNGRIEVYSVATFRNETKLNHVGGVVSKGSWVYLDPEYARELEEKGLVFTRKGMNLARPFPVPDVDERVPLKVAFTPSVSCMHLRKQSGGKKYDKNRKKDIFWTIQKEKMGTEDLDLKQWSNYPFECSLEPVGKKSLDISESQNFEYYG